MARNFDFLVKNMVAGSGHPGYGADLRDTLVELHDRGIRAILTLTVDPLPAGLLREYGMESAHIPIVDFTAPAPAQIDEAVAFMQRNVGERKPTLVHCGAGYGRTGTILACWLVAEGRTADEAISEVRVKRPGSIEAPEQEQAVMDYAARVERTKPRGGETKDKRAD